MNVPSATINPVVAAARVQKKQDAPGGVPVEDHIVAETQTPDDAAALRSLLARQYGHFAEHLSRASFEQLIGELALGGRETVSGYWRLPLPRPHRQRSSGRSLPPRRSGTGASGCNVLVRKAN